MNFISNTDYNVGDVIVSHSSYHDGNIDIAIVKSHDNDRGVFLEWILGGWGNTVGAYSETDFKFYAKPSKLFKLIYDL